MSTETKQTLMESRLLRLPVQVAPVDRPIVASGLAGNGGIEPSAWYDSLIQNAPAILGGLASLF